MKKKIIIIGIVMLVLSIGLVFGADLVTRVATSLSDVTIDNTPVAPVLNEKNLSFKCDGVLGSGTINEFDDRYDKNDIIMASQCFGVLTEMKIDGQPLKQNSRGLIHYNEDILGADDCRMKGIYDSKTNECVITTTSDLG